MSDDELRNYVASTPVLADELFREPVSTDLISMLQSLLAGRQTLFVAVSGTPSIVDAAYLNRRNMPDAVLYLPDDLNCIDERGVFALAGTGKGDVFVDAQAVNRKLNSDAPEYNRFIADGSGFTSLDDGTVISGSTKDLLKECAGKGYKPKVAFDAAGLVYVKSSRKTKAVVMTLKDHQEMAEEIAKKIVAALQLDADEANAIVAAAAHHDDGKAHSLWQQALRGISAGDPLAKLPRFHNPKLLGGMRHELVSVLDAKLPELTTWLIASHHGRCRPYFEEKAYDPVRVADSDAFNQKLPEMFDRLSDKYGQWGLAYLEAIVRGIDIQSEQ